VAIFTYSLPISALVYVHQNNKVVAFFISQLFQDRYYDTVDTIYRVYATLRNALYLSRESKVLVSPRELC
jgi:hypothetical protein